jgi:predicted dehydrogenase
MSQANRTTGGDSNRRDFLKTTATAAGTALATGLLPSGVHAAGSDAIKVGLIGCGNRGTGAAENVLSAAPNVTIVALGDAFTDRKDKCRKHLMEFASGDEKVKALGNKVDLPEERCFVGLDAYEKVLGSGPNYIILATPPGFRPQHLEAAVAAGKNIFAEKPVGVDGPGIRKVLAAYEQARKKNLAIAAGTQRRHQLGYLETMKRLHGGAIGDIVAGRCYWMQGILWKVPRTPGMTDLVWQLRDWYNFTWLSGDHIVEQHVHNIDVINWGLNSHPLRAVGMGYRTRTDPNYGHIYDFFATDFEYPRGVHVVSMSRQISNCADSISEALVGTRGTCQVNAHTINGKRIVPRAVERQATDPYVQEHTDLIESIRKGEPINELKNVAESTLSAIMARMSAYTGKEVSWEQALHSQDQLMPTQLAWDMKLPVPPLARPGKTKLF